MRNKILAIAILLLIGCDSSSTINPYNTDGGNDNSGSSGSGGGDTNLPVGFTKFIDTHTCLLYTSDAADDTPCVDLGGRRIIKKK